MKKKGMAIEMIVVLVVALAILVIGAVTIAILSGKGTGAIEYIKQLFRFGG